MDAYSDVPVDVLGEAEFDAAFELLPRLVNLRRAGGRDDAARVGGGVHGERGVVVAGSSVNEEGSGRTKGRRWKRPSSI